MVNADDPFGFKVPDLWDLEPMDGPRRRRNGRRKANKGPERSTRYAGPGHTVVTYDHRTLHYRFKQSKKDYEKAKAARRRRSAKGRGGRRSSDVYLNRDGSYSTATGRDVTYSTRGKADRGDRAIRRRNLARDGYGEVGDMRALLKDARWEEVCGHSRWKYDAQSTVKEYQKYLRYHGKR